MRINPEKREIAVLAIIWLAYACFIIPGLNSPLIIDENVFADAAKSIAETGKPYISDLKSWDNRNYDGSQSFYFHPPLYINILALIIKVFGESIIALRAFSATAMIASSLLVYLIAKKNSRRNRGEIALLSAFIFLINPLTVKSGLLIDINGTVLTLSILLFTYFFLKWNEHLGKKQVMCLGALMALVMWSKFEGVLLLTASVLVFLFFRQGAKNAVARTATIAGTGIAIFLATFYIIAKIQGIEFFSPFQRNASAIPFIGHDLLPQLMHMAWAAKNFAFWLTPAFFLLSLFLLFRTALKCAKRTPLNELDFLAIFASVNLTFSLLIARDAYGFPKYIIEAVPFLAILIGTLVFEENLLKMLEERKNLKILGICTAILALYSVFLLKDPFILHNMFWTENVSFNSDMAAYIISGLWGILFFVPIPAMAAAMLFTAGPARRAVLFSLLFLLVFYSGYINTVQATAEYSTIYAYGQKGFKDAAIFVAENSNKEDALFARIDFCYHTKLKCYRNYFEEDLTRESFLEALSDKNLRHAILSVKDRPETYPGFEEKFALEKETGHFRIYRAAG